MVILLPPVAEPALASALPRRRSLRDRPCQGTTVRDLVALRAGLSRAATLHLRPRTPEPRASLARIALLLTRLKPPCTSLLAPGRSPPLESCSCTHTLTPPASAPCLLQPCRVVPTHPRSSAHSAPPRTCCSTRAPASPAFAPTLATPEPTRCFHCAALQLLFAQRPRASAVASPAQSAPSRSALPVACSLVWPHAAWPEPRAAVRLGHQPARAPFSRALLTPVRHHLLSSPELARVPARSDVHRSGLLRLHVSSACHGPHQPLPPPAPSNCRPFPLLCAARLRVLALAQPLGLPATEPARRSPGAVCSRTG
jgi:hypothetical protein